MEDAICKAIAERKVISFSYKGQRRTVEPHLVGYNKSGALALSAWFLRGGSESNEGEGWRVYMVSEMSSLDALAERFDGPRPGYKADGGKSFQNIQCAL
jgi:hypothetical protein